MNYVDSFDMKELIEKALKEDIGVKDITTEGFVPENRRVKAGIIAKQGCVVCGIHIAGAVFKHLDDDIKFTTKARDGQKVRRGRLLCILEGKARSILTAERVALNFLSLLCGISTKTRTFVEAVKPYKAKILDTRKTFPGLRVLEKYAVRMGGGFNHRFKLDEMLMVKDNHRAVAGDIRNLKTRLPLQWIHPLEVEVNNLKELKEALELRPDIIMLDNMSLGDMRKAVRLRPGPLPKLEASGGINLKNVRRIASTGVDVISVGCLTHSVDSIDISLEIL